MDSKIFLFEEYNRIWQRVKNEENFALIRNGDGERGLILGRPFSAQEGWKSPNKQTLLGKAIKDSNSIIDPNYIIGISCPCCDIDAYHWYLQNIPSRNLTFANLWVNSNYQRFISDFSELNRDAIIIANHRAQGKKIGNLNILKYYSVSDDCVSFWENEAGTLINKVVADFGDQKNLLFVVSAGPMSGPIIAALFKHNPNNCYLDCGSAIDAFYYEKQTRPYMDPSTVYAQRKCWMHDPANLDTSQKIHKTIHYCWFGHGKMSKLMKKCIRSWKKYCPDYEIIEWNEDNFDVNSTIWTKQAYEAKKWAFVSDYVRLWVLYNYGGIYMDTDVEVRKPLDRFLIHSAFSGFENPEFVPTGIMGSAKGHPAIKMWLDYYKDRPYIVDGKPEKKPNVRFMTDMMLEQGLILNNEYQEIAEMAFYPQTYFCPLNVVENGNCISEKTHTIHHFTSTWRTKKEMRNFRKSRFRKTGLYRNMIWFRYLPNRAAQKVLGNECYEKLKQILKRG